MSGTCIGYEMIVSVRPCLGHGIGTLPMFGLNEYLVVFQKDQW
ncbi:hypothetical protein F383_13206 [Gossypium arboreum]|uniref:Uncharacterized protein n=1 Tax=Gossypium arboreum TaxID=29729 RepID=A0A0B0PRG1_GOSAR|nr:hypothetical protein F383_13206 [Gossypium arboreum]